MKVSRERYEQNITIRKIKIKVRKSWYLETAWSKTSRDGKFRKRENPDHFVLSIGTNDRDSDRSPDLIAKSILDVASSLKTDKHDVAISNIIKRNDRSMAKANEVNRCLTELCLERKFLLIDHFKTWISALEWE